jgi:hypothetical protein
MTQALDIIRGALRRINSYQPGETIAAPDEQDCLDTLNDLLDSWSIDKQFVFGSNENILSWVSGQRLYKVGNPTCTLLGSQPFTGTLTSSSNVITGITNVPGNLLLGATLTDLSNLIPPGTTVTAIGVNTVTMSANATNNSAGSDQITYTVPGDFAISRPLRITHGFTRFNQLDFELNVCETQTQYTSILYKAQPGPWPTVAWYNNTFPYGLLNVYQTPGNNAELHLFTDTILSNLTLTQTIVMPQGYSRALKWCLAKELCAEYGFPLSDAVKLNAAESLNMIKALNARPAEVSRYDRELARGNRGDAGWIMHGGYR